MPSQNSGGVGCDDGSRQPWLRAVDGVGGVVGPVLTGQDAQRERRKPRTCESTEPRGDDVRHLVGPFLEPFAVLYLK